MKEERSWFRALPSDEMADGDMRNINVGDVAIALYRLGGEFFATSNVCTHAFAILTDGWLECDVVECPLHAGRFNVRTGKALGDPVEQDLQTFPVRTVDGYVEIFVTELS